MQHPSIQKKAIQSSFLAYTDFMEDCCAPKKPDPFKWLQTYKPLILILAYLLLAIFITDFYDGQLDLRRAMPHFMGGFFLIFSFFKMLDLQGFADAYQTYDVIAKHSRSYAYLYPFIELGLGIGYLSSAAPTFINATTLIVMTVSSIGVLKSILSKKEIKCACLGTMFKLPMTSVTLFEDLLMVVMAGVSFIA